MALRLTDRERQLIEAFRACDQDSKARIEAAARQRPGSAASGLHPVQPIQIKPRPLVMAIFKAAEQLPREGRFRMLGAAGAYLEQYPYSVPPSSVDLSGRPAEIVELVRLMERTSDEGLGLLQLRLRQITPEYSAHQQEARVIHLSSVRDPSPNQDE
jgi:hypothetical protein